MTVGGWLEYIKYQSGPKWIITSTTCDHHPPTSQQTFEVESE